MSAFAITAPEEWSTTVPASRALGFWASGGSYQGTTIEVSDIQSVGRRRNFIVTLRMH